MKKMARRIGGRRAHQRIEPLEVRQLLTQFVGIDTVGSLGLSSQGSHLGQSVSIDGDLAVIGAPEGHAGGVRSGIAAIYSKDDAGTEDPADDTWDLLTTLSADEPQPGLRFGAAVSVVGQTIAVGAPDDGSSGSRGSVFVFEEIDGQWVQQRKFSGRESFGTALELTESHLVVGAPLSSRFARAAGEVSVFRTGNWKLQQRLAHPLAAAGDAFGSSVDIVDARIAVGSPLDDHSTINDGTVLLYELTESEWQFSELIGSPQAALDARFGSAVALAADRMVAGAPHQDAGSAWGVGAVYSFDLSGGQAVSDGQLTIGTPVEGERFGTALAVDDSRLLIGAPAAARGRAFGYQWRDGAWQGPRALDSGSRAGDRFGASVAFDGAAAVVGVPSFDVVGAETGSGKSFYFSGTDWEPTRTSRLRLPAVEGEFPADFDAAGWAVETDGHTAVVGVPQRDQHRRADAGQVVVYVKDENGTPEDGSDDFWIREAVLEPDSPRDGDEFGAAVDVSGDRIVVGAPRQNNGRRDGGSVHVYERTNGVWSQTTTIVPADNKSGDEFGTSVALNGDLLVVGAPLVALSKKMRDTGLVYTFTFDGSDWIPQQTLSSADPQTAARFGASVSTDGERVAVGMPGWSGAAEASGGVEVFLATDGTWTHEAILSVANSGIRDFVGTDVAIEAATVAAGAPGFDTAGRDSGAVHLFRFDASWALSETLLPSSATRDGRFGNSLDLTDGDLAVGADGAGLVDVFSTSVEPAVRKQVLSNVDLSFGRSVSIAAGTIVVGAPDADHRAVASGRAHLFQLVRPPGISVHDATASEADEVMSFRLSRSHARGDARVQIELAPGTALEGEDFSQPESLWFELPHGQSEVTLDVPLVGDFITESDESFGLTLTDAVFATLEGAHATGTILDDDEPGLVITESDESTAAEESAAADSVWVHLSVRPNADVLVHLSIDTDEATLSTAEFRFTPENWQEPQEVQIAAVNDDRVDSESVAELTVTIAPESDPLFADVPPEKLRVDLIDDDVAGVLVSQTKGSSEVNELGDRDRVTIRLSSEPSGPVTVELASADTTEVLLDTTAVHFDAETWSIPQSVRVIGVDDTEIDGATEVQVTAEVSASSAAAEYLLVEARAIPVINHDHELDFGFASPATFPTALSGDGARHLISPDLKLGTTISSEADASTEADEANDGVAFTGGFVAGKSVTATITSSGDGFVSAWLDLNGDGDWSDFGERVLHDRAVQSGENTFSLDLPAYIPTGNSMLRVRLSSTGGLLPGGLAEDGEVEDYVVRLVGMPRAVNDEFEISGDGADLNVLANDRHFDPLELVRVTDAENARVEVNGNRVRFVPDSSFQGDVEFRYIVRGKQRPLSGVKIRGGDQYGFDVAVDGDLAVVGAPGVRSGAGAVDVFRRSRKGWEFDKRLVAEVRTDGVGFGSSVAVFGDTIVIGAPDDGSGSVTVFTDAGGLWERVATVRVGDENADAAFGAAVAGQGQRFVVGAPGSKRSGESGGSAYVYELTESGVQQVNRLRGSDTDSNDQFGTAVAISDDLVLVGAPKDDIRGNNSGAAYLFVERPSGDWVQRQRFAPKVLSAGDLFGHAVDLSSSTLVISAPLDDESQVNSGAVWTFGLDSDGVFRTRERIKPSRVIARGRFGESVDLDGDRLVVGWRVDSTGPVLFERGQTWRQYREFTAGGYAAAISNGLVLFGRSDSSVEAELGGGLFAANTRQTSGRVTVHVR